MTLFGSHSVNLLAVVILPLAACIIAVNAPSVAPAPHIRSSRGAERAVLFAPFLSPYLTIDEGEKHIVAVAGYLKEIAAETLLGVVYPRAASLSSVMTAGRTAIPGDPEAVLLLRPDAVITWTWFSDALASAGLPVVVMGYDARQSQEQNALAAWTEISRVAGRVAHGNELVARYQRERDNALKYVATIKTAIPPRAVFLYNLGTGAIYAAGGTNSDAVAMREAGAVNLAPDGGLIDEEQLLLVNPDIIFLGCCSGEASTPPSLYSQLHLTAVAAIRNRRVYKTPWESAWMNRVVQGPLELRWLAELLYRPPPPSNFRSTLKDTYRDVYHVALDDEAIDRALFAGENRASAGFSRFARPSSP